MTDRWFGFPSLTGEGKQSSFVETKVFLVFWTPKDVSLLINVYIIGNIDKWALINILNVLTFSALLRLISLWSDCMLLYEQNRTGRKLLQDFIFVSFDPVAHEGKKEMGSVWRIYCSMCGLKKGAGGQVGRLGALCGRVVE